MTKGCSKEQTPAHWEETVARPCTQSPHRCPEKVQKITGGERKENHATMPRGVERKKEMRKYCSEERLPAGI